MLKMVSGVVLAGAVALASTVAMAQSSTNTMPGGGAKMNNAPSGDAMSDKSSPAMKTPGMAAPMKKHSRKKMKHSKKKMM